MISTLLKSPAALALAAIALAARAAPKAKRVAQQVAQSDLTSVVAEKERELRAHEEKLSL